MVLLLEIARGLAALWVFLYHVSDLFINSSPLVHKLAIHGHLGVPMFFVISGYVITHSAESGLASNKLPLTFLKSRFIRIYPAFWISIVVVILVPYAVEIISSLKSGQYLAPKNILLNYSYFEWLNVALLTKVFWATTDDLQAQFNRVNSVYWTLAIEFQFYLAVFFALTFRRHFKKVIAGFTLVSFAAIQAPFIINHGLFIYYWPSFSVGIALYYLSRRDIGINNIIHSTLVRVVALATSIALIIGSIISSDSDILFSVCFGFFLWVMSAWEEGVQSKLSDSKKMYYFLIRPFLLLGAMSYSVYLLHAKIYQLPSMIARQLLDDSSIFFALFVIIGTLIMCYPFYYYVERRFMSSRGKNIQSRSLVGS